MMRLSKHMKRAFVFAGATTALLGIAFSAASVFAPGALDAIYQRLGSVVSSDMGPAARLGVGIYGGLMAGWGTMLALIGREVPIARATGVGLLTWWVVDSAASVALGYPLNALSNALLLLPFLPILVAMVRGDHQPETA